CSRRCAAPGTSSPARPWCAASSTPPPRWWGRSWRRCCSGSATWPSCSRPRLVREAVDGVRAVTHDRDLSLVLGLAAAQSFTRGALTVLSVVVAIELLGTGEPGVGALMTAVGVGAVLGSLAASLLVGTARLGAWFAVGVGLWGLPLTLVGLAPQDATALGLLALVGVGNALIDLAGFTL